MDKRTNGHRNSLPSFSIPLRLLNPPPVPFSSRLDLANPSTSPLNSQTHLSRPLNPQLICRVIIHKLGLAETYLTNASCHGVIRSHSLLVTPQKKKTNRDFGDAVRANSHAHISTKKNIKKERKPTNLALMPMNFYRRFPRTALGNSFLASLLLAMRDCLFRVLLIPLENESKPSVTPYLD